MGHGLFIIKSILMTTAPSDSVTHNSSGDRYEEVETDQYTCLCCPLTPRYHKSILHGSEHIIPPLCPTLTSASSSLSPGNVYNHRSKISMGNWSPNDRSYLEMSQQKSPKTKFPVCLQQTTARCSLCVFPLGGECSVGACGRGRVRAWVCYQYVVRGAESPLV